MSAVIEANDVRKRYRGAATDALSATFSVEQGEIVGLLGPNGAGKTTLTKLLCGIIPSTSGSLRVLGRNPNHDGVFVKQRIGVVHQRPTFDMFLSADDNLRIFAAFHGLRWRGVKPQADALLETFELSHKRGVPVFTLSGGELRRLQVVRVLLLRDAQLLLLDEPSAGLDVSSRRRVWSELRALNQTRGVTIMWTSHYVAELERNCDRVLVLNHGHVVRFDTPTALLRASGDEHLVMEFSRPVDLSRCAPILDGDHCRFSIEQRRIEVSGAAIREKLPALLAMLGAECEALASVNVSSKTLEDAYVGLLEGDDAARATS